MGPLKLLRSQTEKLEKPINKKEETPTWRIKGKKRQVRLLTYLRRTAAAATEALSHGGEQEIKNGEERYKDGAELLSNGKRA